MEETRRPFAVGRRTPRGTTVVVLRKVEAPPIRGPWTLQAVVTDD